MVQFHCTKWSLEAHFYVWQTNVLPSLILQVFFFYYYFTPVRVLVVMLCRCSASPRRFIGFIIISISNGFWL